MAKNKPDVFYFKPYLKAGDKSDLENAIYKFNVFVGYKNKQSIAQAGYLSLLPSEQNAIKSLIKAMAVRGPGWQPYGKVQWSMKGDYSYGEIKKQKKSFRFFFFQVVDNNLIIFHFADKDQDSLGTIEYVRIEKIKEEYEEEFLKRL